MKTIQVYYIIIVILIVIILWQLFKSSNENFVCSPPNYSEATYDIDKLTEPSLKTIMTQFKTCLNNNDFSNCKAKAIHAFQTAHISQVSAKNNRNLLHKIVNDLQNSNNSYTNCTSGYSCAKTLIPVFTEIKNAYTEHAQEYPDVQKFMNNYVACNTDFITNNLNLPEAEAELKECINNYTECNTTCKNDMYNIEGKYNNIAKAISTTNTECPNIFPTF